MKNAKKIISVIAAMAVAATMAVSVSADDESAKAVVAVEKFTIGGGFVLEPTVVELDDGDTAATVFEKALGAENINNGDGAGTYIASVKTSSEGELLPEITAAMPEDAEVTAPADPEWLANYDYYSMSGWMFLINGESSMVGVADYTVNDGDVLQLCFSAIGYGSDIGLDTSSMAEWGGMAPLYEVADRTECYAEAFTNSDVDWSSVASVYATADDCAALVTADEADDTDDSIEDDTADAETDDATDDTTDDAAVTVDDAADETDTANTADKTANPSTGVADVTAMAVISLGALAVAVSAKKRG